MFDREAFEERAAIAEFDGGLSRFEAETLAARAQGLTRWQAMREVENAERVENPAAARDQRQVRAGDAANHLPGMQPAPEEESGPVPVGDLSAGRDRGLLSPLRMENGCSL